MLNTLCIIFLTLGAVHKLRLQEEGGRWSKTSTFCKLSYHRKCKRRGIGGKKKSNFVYIVCERPPKVFDIREYQPHTNTTKLGQSGQKITFTQDTFNMNLLQY